jgi:uncharacterized protein
MAKAILIHGTGDKPDFWFPWLKQKLEEQGVSVWMPTLPDPENPDLNKQLPFLVESQEIENDSILISHSAGCPLLLAYLEQSPYKIKQVILVSGYYQSEKPDPIFKENYDWEKIKANCSEFVFINSDNDPWGCTDEAAKPTWNKIGGLLIVPKGEAHMGSTKFNQPYKEFPLVLKLINL